MQFKVGDRVKAKSGYTYKNYDPKISEIDGIWYKVAYDRYEFRWFREDEIILADRFPSGDLAHGESDPCDLNYTQSSI